MNFFYSNLFFFRTFNKQNPLSLYSRTLFLLTLHGWKVSLISKSHLRWSTKLWSDSNSDWPKLSLISCSRLSDEVAAVELVQDSMMRSPLPSKKETLEGLCCRRRCRCHRPVEPIKKVRRLGVWNPRKKTHSLFLCSYGSVVQNPDTNSVLELDID